MHSSICLSFSDHAYLHDFVNSGTLLVRSSPLGLRSLLDPTFPQSPWDSWWSSTDGLTCKSNVHLPVLDLGSTIHVNLTSTNVPDGK